MSGRRIGYIRVSSFDQNPERQLEGVSVNRVFTDKASGKDTKRPELDRLLAFVREGDLRCLGETLTKYGTGVTSSREAWPSLARTR